jgi:integrase
MATLVDQYLEWLRIRECSARTINDRRRILTIIDRELPEGIDRATADEIKEWLYRDTWSTWTRATYYGAIRGLFVWATNPADPRLDYDPTALLPRPPARQCLPKPITNAELVTILTKAAEPYRTWALLGAYEGLRCMEIAGLDREHVTEETTTIARGKGGKPGIIPTHPAVWMAVQDLPSGPVAVTKHGLRASAQYVSIQALLYFRTIGLRGVSMHRLRHWYGTELYRRTKDLRRTQELLRHSSPNSTMIYTLISDEERQEAIRALPTFTES